MIQTVVRNLDLKEFGVYFAKLREASGYRSQRELSDLSGVSHSTINRAEAGTHKISPEKLKQVAPYLKDVTYDELMEKLGYRDDAKDIPEDYMFDPDIQFIARSKQEMTPEAFRKLMELTRMAKDMVNNQNAEKDKG